MSGSRGLFKELTESISPPACATYTCGWAALSKSCEDGGHQSDTRRRNVIAASDRKADAQSRYRLFHSYGLFLYKSGSSVTLEVENTANTGSTG